MASHDQTIMDKMKIQSNFLDTWGLSVYTNKAPISGTAHTILHHFFAKDKMHKLHNGQFDVSAISGTRG